MVATWKTRQAAEVRIDLKNEHDILHWAKRFRVTREQLREAVEAVGNGPSAVEKHLSSLKDRVNAGHHV